MIPFCSTKSSWLARGLMESGKIVAFHASKFKGRKRLLKVEGSGVVKTSRMMSE